MGRYASETTMPVEKSRAEIEETLRRYKASAFNSGWSENSATVAFKLNDLFIRFVLPLFALVLVALREDDELRRAAERRSLTIARE